MDEHLTAHTHGATPVHADVHHEETDINVRAVLIGSAIFVVFTILMLLMLWGTYEGFLAIDRRLDPEAVSAIPAAADEQDFVYGNIPKNKPEFTDHWSAPVEYLEKFRKSEDEILTRYGESATAGMVRVPIEDAKDLALRRGYPVRSEASRALSDLEMQGWSRPSWVDPRSGVQPQTEIPEDSLIGEAMEEAEAHQ